MHMAALRLSDLRAWSRLIPVKTKNFRYSPATILLNSLLKKKWGARVGSTRLGGHQNADRDGMDSGGLDTSQET